MSAGSHTRVNKVPIVRQVHYHRVEPCLTCETCQVEKPSALLSLHCCVSSVLWRHWLPSKSLHILETASAQTGKWGGKNVRQLLTILLRVCLPFLVIPDYFIAGNNDKRQRFCCSFSQQPPCLAAWLSNPVRRSGLLGNNKSLLGSRKHIVNSQKEPL